MFRLHHTPLPARTSRRVRWIAVAATAVAAALVAALLVPGGFAQASGATPRTDLQAAAQVTPNTTINGVIPVGNSAWAYDNAASGLWAPVVAAYNKAATAGHKLTQLFSYATDMEMYCPGNDPTKCTPADLQSYYTPTGAGFSSTLSYSANLNLAPNISTGAITENVSLSPIIDGRTDAGGFLIGFNQLSASLADTYADQVAAQVCADPRVDGIQFDIEPFNVATQNGQYNFYLQIGKDFAGEHTGNTATDPYGCVSAGHPAGRYFSVFTFAASIQSGTASATNVAAFTSAYHNGYVIDSLYDLGTNPAGTLNDLPTYKTLVTQEATNMKTWADAASIPYAYGIPGAASAHEFTTCLGSVCKPGANGTTGNPMISYAKDAVTAITGVGAPADALFVGTDVWDFGGSTIANGANVGPAPAQPDVLKYLATNLPS